MAVATTTVSSKGQVVIPRALREKYRLTSGTRLHVRQSGFEESARWRRYYEVIGAGWERALASLKMLLEK